MKQQPGLLTVLGGLAGGLVGSAVSRHQSSAVWGVALGVLGGAAGDYMFHLREMERRAQIPEMAGYLCQHLGDGVTAYLSGIEDPRLARSWAQGVAIPAPEQWERLQAAYEAALCLVEDCGDDMTRSWFFGMNDALGDIAPVDVLRRCSQENWVSVVEAAQEFAEI